MYLLDTNICIALNNDNAIVRTEFTRKADRCYISTPVLAELYKGVYYSQRVKQNLAVLQQFLTLVLVIDFDRIAAEEFGKIKDELRRIGRLTGEVDALIAAAARSRQDILVTNNICDFENIQNLQLESWLEAEQ